MYFAFFAALVALQLRVSGATSCTTDSCLKVLQSNSALASVFCASYTSLPTAAVKLPSFLTEFGAVASTLSSACSCFATTTSSSKSSITSSSKTSTTSPITSSCSVKTITITTTDVPNCTPSISISTATLPAVTSYITLVSTADITLNPTTSYVTVDFTSIITYVSTLTSNILVTSTETEVDISTSTSNLFITTSVFETDTATVTLDIAFTSTEVDISTFTSDIFSTATDTLVMTSPTTITKSLDITLTPSTVTTTTTLTTSSVCSGPTNLLQNPGFESGNLNGWTLSANPNDNPGAPEESPSDTDCFADCQGAQNSGSCNLECMTLTSYPNFYLSQTVTVCPGQPYILSFWFANFALACPPGAIIAGAQTTAKMNGNINGDDIQYYQYTAAYAGSPPGVTSITVGISDQPGCTLDVSDWDVLLRWDDVSFGLAT